MRRLVAPLWVARALVACEKDTPLVNVSGVDGTYAGTWTLSWATNNPNIDPPGETYFCPGSITLENGFRDAIHGAFLIRAEGDCLDASRRASRVARELRGGVEALSS